MICPRRAAAMKNPGTGVTIGASLVLVVALAGWASVQASVVRQLTDTKSAYPRPGVLDDAGTMVITNVPTNQLGGNPLQRWQIFKFDAATGAGQQLTDLRQGVSDGSAAVSVSDDGLWIAFISSSDPLGSNHDGSPEVFVMLTNGSGLAQVTSDPAPNAGTVSALAMSGSANRIVYVSNSNPLGTNAAHVDQVFVVDRNGANLRQLTSTTTLTAMGYSLSMSDDGQRIAFWSRADLTGGNADLGYEVFVILADGTGLRQLTSASSSTYASQSPFVSGNGAKVTFESKGDLLPTGNADHSFEVFVVNWDGTGLAQLTNANSRDSRYPSITDNGLTVTFMSNRTVGASNPDGNDEVWKIQSDGTGSALLTSTSFYPNAAYGPPIVSGSGNRCAFVYNGTLPPSTLNPDAGPELYVRDLSGGFSRQLTVTTQLYSYAPSITNDGSRVIFLSNANPFGTNASHTEEIFRVQADGSDLVQITSSLDAYAPAISPDGSLITFVSNEDPTGENFDGSAELFVMNVDGTGLRQLTDDAGSFANTYYSDIAANNSVIVFYSSNNVTGQNADGSTEIFSIQPDGTNARQLSNAVGYNAYFPQVDAAGVWVVFAHFGDLTGGNPDHSQEIFRVRTDGTGLQQISSDPTRHSSFPDISAAGDLIAYVSGGDPFGTNPEHNLELFLWKSSTGVSQQLTFTDKGSTTRCSISPNGAYIYFYSSAEIVEEDDDYAYDLYRYAVATASFERVGARHNIEVLAKPLAFQVYTPAVDGTGTRVAVSTEGDLTGENGDRLEEVWLIDRAAQPRIQVSRTLPTLVSWDHESGPIRYDLIRGSVSAMGPGPGTVNLGPTVCLDNDSPVNENFGHEDPVGPAPGAAFFYAYRGSDGLDVGPGSYGVGSNNGQRVPTSGDCTP